MLLTYSATSDEARTFTFIIYNFEFSGSSSWDGCYCKTYSFPWGPVRVLILLKCWAVIFLCWHRSLLVDNFLVNRLYPTVHDSIQTDAYIEAMYPNVRTNQKPNSSSLKPLEGRGENKNDKFIFSWSLTWLWLIAHRILCIMYHTAYSNLFSRFYIDHTQWLLHSIHIANWWAFWDILDLGYLGGVLSKGRTTLGL